MLNNDIEVMTIQEFVKEQAIGSHGRCGGFVGRCGGISSDSDRHEPAND